MIRKTIVKELKELFRDDRVRYALIIVLLLLGVAVWISAKRYQTINAEFEMATQKERSLWDQQGEKNPHSAAHFGTYAFKPKYALSLIDPGVDTYVGTSIFLEAHNRNEAQFSKASDQTGLARFGNLSPDFILLFIMPLLIILLGYNSFTKEREMENLNLLKSQGLIPWKWVLGKWLALFIPVFVISLILLLITGIGLMMLEDFGTFQWSALLWMFGIYMVYYGVFIHLVLIISAKAKSSGIALVSALFVWILGCLVAPKTASNLAESKYPYPTNQEFAARVAKDKKEGLDGHNPWSKEAKLLQEKVLKEHGVDSLHKLPFNFDAYRMQKGEEHEAAVFFKHYQYLKTQYTKQSKVYNSLAVISPYLPTRFTSMALAHTDYGTHWDFADAAENYRIKMQAFLNSNFAENSSYGNWGYKANADFWKQLPKFEYQPPSLSETLKQNQTHIVILGLWFFAGLGVLFITTKSF